MTEKELLEGYFIRETVVQRRRLRKDAKDRADSWTVVQQKARPYTNPTQKVNAPAPAVHVHPDVRKLFFGNVSKCPCPKKRENCFDCFRTHAYPDVPSGFRERQIQEDIHWFLDERATRQAEAKKKRQPEVGSRTEILKGSDRRQTGRW